MTKYKVTYAIDSLDPNPETIIFDSFYEAEDYIAEESERRVSFIVQHSPYSISDRDLESIRESEMSLIRIEEVHD